MSLSNIPFQLKRFEAFERGVIAPAVYSGVVPLAVEVVEVDRDLLPSEAAQLDFRPVDLGFRWGPKWQRAWFRLSGSVPDGPSRETVLRFSSGTEALLFAADAPWQGFDDNRDTAPLPPGSIDKRGQCVAFVEAECMHPWGVSAFTWDTTETHRRWASRDPGHLTLAEIACFHEPVWKLLCAYRFARQLLEQTPHDDTRSRMLVCALDRATGLIDDVDVPTASSRALDAVMGALDAGADAPSSRVVAVGHAHIDTAWLWTLDHTRRKTQRSWSNVVRLADRFDDFRFMCSQPYQYATLESDAPELSASIDRLVSTGQWEPFGAMWVEPDCSVPSLESLIRQIDHGTRYFEQRFGEAGRQRCVFLPDTFGFPASLPTIMVACGLDTFITNKMSWNQTNQMPSTSFVWCGIDGSEVLAHLTPGGDYNASITPKELIKGERRAAVSPPSEQWLQPFGFGDGGGGPTDWQIENARLARSCPGLPRVELGTAAECIERLHRDRRGSAQTGSPWPVWNGELYLELHRGTLTTQAELKRLNRACELRLREAEMFTADDTDSAIHDELGQLWQDLLLHQFHDILPGSSIREVNIQSEAKLREVECRAIEIRDRPATDQSQPSAALFNPASSDANGVVHVNGAFRFVRGVPACTQQVLEPTEARAVERSGTSLQNGIIRAVIGEEGQIISLVLLATGRELCSDGAPMHRLRLYRDRPHMWDAWDIDPGYEADELPMSAASSVVPGIADPLRASLVATFRIGDRSAAEVEYILDAESALLMVETRVDWRETHRLLRVDYPAAVRSSAATFEIQGGVIERPTHRNTPWDRARFEVPVQRWMDISDPSAGLAVINACKYGASAHHSTLGLSLLRSPTHPDEEADRGTHVIRTAIMPHAGDWRAARVADAAEQFNAPLLVTNPMKPCAVPRISVQGSARCEITAYKRGSRDPSKQVMRCVETHGSTGELRVQAPRRIFRCDALERETGEIINPGDPISINPFEIITLAW